MGVRFLSLFLVGCCCAAAGAEEPDAKGIEFFEKNIRPILVQHCFECHADKDTKGGLRLDSREGWRIGGDTGPAIEPGKPDESLLIQSIRYGGDYEMPPKGKLPDKVIADFERWVAMGAPDPRAAKSPEQKPTGLDLVGGRKHWSYQPLRVDGLPPVQDATWPHNAIDFFILSRLEEKKLKPAGEASRAVLVRRLYFDLQGIPPSPDEIDAFVNDTSPDAYERLVDRLMGSPQFGQRWGRHWLDVARFAESMTLRGFVFKEAWRYRDYVIDSFNGDRPYDQFIREQIAGDLLSSNDLVDRQRKLTATTYLALGNTNLEEQDKKQLEMDVVDEQLDVIGKGILAQTITCARCHDHKFDPIPTRDYYALAGIFKNVKSLEHANVSKWVESPLPLEPTQEEKFRQYEAQVAALEKKIRPLKEAAKLVAVANAPSPDGIVPLEKLPGIVVDDLQAKRVGMWKESQHSKPYVGDGYLHDLDQGKGERTLTFAPELPRDGRYEVRFAYTVGQNRATNVPLTVFSADGEKTIQVNEQEPGLVDGRWVSLGQFRFERAGQSFVIVSNEATNGHVIADAVQFLPLDAVTTDTAPASTSATSTKGAIPEKSKSVTAELKRLERDLKQLTSKAPYRPAAMTVVEQPEIKDIQVNIRGSIHNLGATVPRGFLQVCLPESEPLPNNQSGRKQLADWLVSRDNPLTARVYVNRAWHWLFGAGLVPTVDNFGTTGEAPSHPELLDYLARQLVEQDWSVKQIVREIVLSRTYRQGTAGESKAQAALVDPENRLLWQRNRRRLDAESLRDGMLSASGQLRLEMGGASFSGDLAADYGYQHTGTRRSVYEPVFRNAQLELFEAFDFADPSVVVGRRNVSTVAPQALFLMNHPFVFDQSRHAAERLLAENASDPPAIVDAAFRLVLGRLPTMSEKQSSLEFLALTDPDARTDHGVDKWAKLFQSLFASIDFRYLE
jgi:hypothetical protein